MTRRMITIGVGGRDFALDIDCVREAVTARPLLSVPLAPAPLAGLLLMRGDVIAAIDLRRCFGLDPVRTELVDAVVIERRAVSLALVVDTIGDVIDVPDTGLLPPPDTLPADVARLARSTCMYQHRGLLVLDESQLFAAAVASPKELVR